MNSTDKKIIESLLLDTTRKYTCEILGLLNINLSKAQFELLVMKNYRFLLKTIKGEK
jgi:hypothetical protein